MRKLIAVFALIAIFAGCSTNSVNAIRNKTYKMKPKNVQDQRIITDSYLADRLLVTSVRESKIKGGLKKFQIGMRNTRTGMFASDEPYKIVYKFAWFNIDGIEVPITDEEGWKEKFIIPGDIIWINSIAPNKDCHDFVLRLKALN